MARLQGAYNETYQILRPWILDRSASSKPLRTYTAEMPAHFNASYAPTDRTDVDQGFN